MSHILREEKSSKTLLAVSLFRDPSRAATTWESGRSTENIPQHKAMQPWTQIEGFDYTNLVILNVLIFMPFQLHIAWLYSTVTMNSLECIDLQCVELKMVLFISFPTSAPECFSFSFVYQTFNPDFDTRTVTIVKSLKIPSTHVLRLTKILCSDNNVWLTWKKKYDYSITLKILKTRSTPTPSLNIPGFMNMQIF